MKEFERLSKITPSKNTKFNHDSVSDKPTNLIGDRIMISKIRDCFNEFKRDGASHSWSTFRIDGVVDATMNNKNAAVIISHLEKKKYFLE